MPGYNTKKYRDKNRIKKHIYLWHVKNCLANQLLYYLNSIIAILTEPSKYYFIFSTFNRTRTNLDKIEIFLTFSLCDNRMPMSNFEIYQPIENVSNFQLFMTYSRRFNFNTFFFWNVLKINIYSRIVDIRKVNDFSIGSSKNI